MTYLMRLVHKQHFPSIDVCANKEPCHDVENAARRRRVDERVREVDDRHLPGSKARHLRCATFALCQERLQKSHPLLQTGFLRRVEVLPLLLELDFESLVTILLSQLS